MRRLSNGNFDYTAKFRALKGNMAYVDAGIRECRKIARKVQDDKSEQQNEDKQDERSSEDGLLEPDPAGDDIWKKALSLVRTAPPRRSKESQALQMEESEQSEEQKNELVNAAPAEFLNAPPAGFLNAPPDEFLNAAPPDEFSETADFGYMYKLLTGKKLEAEQQISYKVEREIKERYLGGAATNEDGATEKREHTQEVRDFFKTKTAMPAARAFAPGYMRLALRLTPILGVVSLSFLISNIAVAEKKLADGRSQLDATTYDAAIASLTDSARRNPLRSETYYVLGLAYDKKGERTNAIKNYSLCLMLDRNQIKALSNRASAHRQLGDAHAAYKDYTRLFALEPDPGPTERSRYLNAGWACDREGRQEEAIRYFDAVLKHDPDDVDAIAGKFYCQAHRKNFDGAVILANELISRRPSSNDALVMRGWCYMQAGKSELASKDFEAALKRDSGHAWAWLNKGHLLKGEGKAAAALYAYDRCIARAPHMMEARLARAWALFKNNPAKALADMTEVTKSSQYSNSVSAWAARAKLEYSLGKLARAESSFKKAISIDPNEPELSVWAAESLIGQSKFEEAIALCNKALANNPFLAIAYVVRGTAHAHLNNQISALADMSQAVALDQKSPESRLSRARLYIARGERADARSDLLAVLAAHPDNIEARRLLSSFKPLPRNSGVRTREESVHTANRYDGVPFEQLVALGYETMKAGDSQTASQVLAAAVKKRPYDSMARRYLAHSLVESDPAAAVAQFEALRAGGAFISGDNHSLARALCLASSGNASAVDEVTRSLKALEANAGDTESLYNLAVIYAAAGLTNRASFYCRQGMTSAPRALERKRFQDLLTTMSKPAQPVWQQEDYGG